MASFSSVTDLKPFKTMWKIRVRIIRLWKQFYAAGGLTIEMVVVDSNGVKIHASVKKDLVYQFFSVLSEGSSKIFINFAVGHSCGLYRTTNHPYTISFLETTRVTNCESPIMASGFNPVNYHDILYGSLNSDYLVDVIGQIVEVSTIEVVLVNGKDTNKIGLQLRNPGGERLHAVLWGRFATDVMEAIQMRRDHAIICVFRFVKIKDVKDERWISNSYICSDVKLNPPLAEVYDFLALLPKDELTLSIVDPRTTDIECGVSVKDNFFIHTPMKTISQFSEARNTETCVVMCTIAAIDSDMGWYYLSCKVCAVKVLNVPNDYNDDGDDEYPIMFSYYCPNCKVDNPNILPRYKLHLIVLDSTGKSKFLLCDTLAIQLIHQPCTELVGPDAYEIEDPEAIPFAIKNLIGKTYLFKVCIQRENYLYKLDTFKVSKIITNYDIISEFEMKFHTKGSLMLSADSSQECVPTDLTAASRRIDPHAQLGERI